MMQMLSLYLPWIGLFIGVALLARAFVILRNDARGGHEVSMGGAIMFSNIWVTGAALCAWNISLLLDLAWWFGLIVFALLVILKTLTHRIVVTLYLGTAMPDTSRQGGFNAFIRRTKDIDKETKNNEM